MHQAPNVRQDQIKFSPVWTPDFKGQIETMDGPYCYPLTVFECYARFLPGCQALDAPPGAAKSAGLPPLLFHVWSARFYPNRQRHPLRLLQALSRTSRLSIWWVPLGTPSRAHSPNWPHKNGRQNPCTVRLKGRPTIPPAGRIRTPLYPLSLRIQPGPQNEALPQLLPGGLKPCHHVLFPRNCRPILPHPLRSTACQYQRATFPGKTHRVAISHALR